MSDTPLWLQVVIPTGTLVGGFALGRVSKFLDRRVEEKDEQRSRRPKFAVMIDKSSRRRNGLGRVVFEAYHLVNTGTANATNVTATLIGEQDPSVVRHLPNKRPMHMGESHPILIHNGPQRYHIQVTCDQFTESVDLYIPD